MAGYKKASQLAQAILVYNKLRRRKIDNFKSVAKDTIISRTGFRNAFDAGFPALYSFHGLDIINALDTAEKAGKIDNIEKAVLSEALYNAIDSVAIKSGFEELNASTWNDINDTIEKIVNIVEFGSEEASEDTITNITKSVKIRLDREIKSLRNKLKKPYIVSYVDKATAQKNYGTPSEPSVKILANSFSIFRDIINNSIKTEVAASISKHKDKLKKDSRILDLSYTTKILFNWGHTRTSSGIVSSKLMRSLVSLKNVVNSDNGIFKIIADDFEKKTGQINTEIKLTQGSLTFGDPAVLSLVLESSYLQKVILQDAEYNQRILGQQEKQWNLAEVYKSDPTSFNRAFGVSTVEQFMGLLLEMTASPSALDRIETKLVGELLGKPVKLQKTNKKLKTVNTVLKVSAKKVKLNPIKNTGKFSKGGNPPPIPETSELDLSRLLNSLNQQITQRVRENMGTGYSKDVLNYRTGRFANSVKVERLSESKAGMITAFYSYMKNPYATFSQGGRQENPRSRDPKLLISKSIREIAATLVTNRLRAVNL